MAEKRLLLEAKPSWLNFVWYFLFFWLVLPLFVAVWKRLGLTLKVYEDKIVVEKGVLSKRISEISIQDIRNIDTRQGLLQRIFGIGDLLIGTAGTAGYESTAYGIAKPKSVKDMIIKQKKIATTK